MINTQKLIEYLKEAPFPESEKTRLIALAENGDDTVKTRVYQLAALFVDRFRQADHGTISIEEEKEIVQKGKNFRNMIRKKAEEFQTNSESAVLQNLEGQLSNI